MKYLKSISFGLVTALFVSQSVFATNRDYSEPIPLSEVELVGTFQCAEREHGLEHKQGHRCDLQFVESKDNRKWNIKTQSELLALHLKIGGPVRATVKAKASPRFLLGGAYIEVQTMELGLPTAAQPPAETQKNDVLYENGGNGRI